MYLGHRVEFHIYNKNLSIHLPKYLDVLFEGLFEKEKYI